MISVSRDILGSEGDESNVTDDYNSASSQFFIVQEDSSYLDGGYAAFGRVTSGMDIVDQICADVVPIDGNGLIAANAQPVIVSITIRT